MSICGAKRALHYHDATSVLFTRLLLDDVVDGLGISTVLERLAKFFFVQQLGDLGERMKVLLKLALRNKEEDHQGDRLVIERVEINAIF